MNTTNVTATPQIVNHGLHLGFDGIDLFISLGFAIMVISIITIMIREYHYRRDFDRINDRYGSLEQTFNDQENYGDSMNHYKTNVRR